MPPAQISGEPVDFDVSIRVVEIEGEELVVIEYKLDRVFGFYQGSTIYPIQREYYKQTYGGGLRWSQSREIAGLAKTKDRCARRSSAHLCFRAYLEPISIDWHPSDTRTIVYVCDCGFLSVTIAPQGKCAAPK